MPELKPCPFCGGTAALADVLAYVSKGVRVRCTRCSAATTMVLIDHPKLNANGLDESTRYTSDQAAQIVADKWNRRM